MASGVTFQALDRLSYLPDRDADLNSVKIAGQDYNDVYFVGGHIEGIVVVPTQRTISASGTIAAEDDDQYLILTTSSSATLQLPAVPSDNQVLNIKKYSTGGNVITVDGNGATIDAQASYPMGGDYAWLKVIWNGTFWSIMG